MRASPVGSVASSGWEATMWSRASMIVRHRSAKNDERCQKTLARGSVHGPDVGPAGGPQQQVVVLGVAAGQLLVDQADPVDQRLPAEQVGRRVGLRHARAEQLGVGDPPAVEDPGRDLAPRLDQHAGGDDLHVGVGGQQLDLGVELARQPQVVVVAEGHQLGGGRGDAGVAGAGQARDPLVAEGADDPLGARGADLLALQVGLGLGLVEHGQHLDVARVALVDDGLHGSPQQHRSVTRGDHHRHRGVVGRVRLGGVGVGPRLVHDPLIGQRTRPM